MLMLKVHIARLWQKLGDDAHNPRYIFAERGLGYRFVRPATVPPFRHFSHGDWYIWLTQCSRSATVRNWCCPLGVGFHKGT